MLNKIDLRSLKARAKYVSQNEEGSEVLQSVVLTISVMIMAPAVFAFGRGVFNMISGMTDIFQDKTEEASEWMNKDKSMQ